MIFQNGYRSSAKIWWTGKLQILEVAGPREPSIPEPPPKAESGQQNVFTHFPKDRNCQVCTRTKITNATCRKRTGYHVPRAENVGDLITADHKVLNEVCESRNSHQYAVFVQDLATRWLQAYPCKTKTSQ